MIVKEFYKTREDGINLYRTYSDANFLIQKIDTEEIYTEAIDIEKAPYQYIETDIPNEFAKEEEITSEEFDNMLREVL